MLHHHFDLLFSFLELPSLNYNLNGGLQRNRHDGFVLQFRQWNEPTIEQAVKTGWVVK